jgi:hypothetical protein
VAKPKLGSGARFNAIEEKAESKGYSQDSAKRIAASVGIKKYGRAKMSDLAAIGKRRAKKISQAE